MTCVQPKPLLQATRVERTGFGIALLSVLADNQKDSLYVCTHEMYLDCLFLTVFFQHAINFNNTATTCTAHTLQLFLWLQQHHQRLAMYRQANSDPTDCFQLVQVFLYNHTCTSAAQRQRLTCRLRSLHMSSASTWVSLKPGKMISAAETKNRAWWYSAN